MSRYFLFFILAGAVLASSACTNSKNLREARVEPQPEMKEVATSTSTPTGAQSREYWPDVVTSADKGPDFLSWTRAADKTVARVGNEELKKSQVFDALLQSMPEETRATIAVLLSNRILAAECEKHGITVPADQVAQWYASQEKILRQQASAEMGKDVDFDRFMKSRFGQSPAQYEKASQDRERARRMLARLIRYQASLEDRVEIRIISVTDRSVALKLREQIDNGADFSILAEQYSVHPSAEQGGLMVPLWRGTLHADLDQVAFDMQTGATSPVIHARDQAGRDRFQIIKLIRRIDGKNLPYAQVENEIVNGITELPLTQDEWYMWQLRLERSGQIQLFDI